MPKIGSVVLHVHDVRRAARFWGEALGYVLRDGPVGDETPVLVAPDGDGTPLALDAEDRTHLDLHVAGEAEQQAEVERLVGLGARRVPWTYPDGADFVVLADPEGNLFCVVNAGGAG
jgi:catechol 2,3-dioxygenase-like lactoylglutathione lyase family enzyme